MEPEVGSSPDVAGSARRILVVDDRPAAARTLATLLRIEGHEVETAEDGPSALDTARRFEPDLILLDLDLPGMTGYEVAEHLRADEHVPRLVAVTGNSQPSDHARAEQAGFDCVLVKPLDLERLRDVIGKLG